jgi:xylulokinase
MYLGIDLGTSSLKVVVGVGGKIIDNESKSYPLSIPHENWSEQNPDDWLNALEQVLTTLRKRWDLTTVKGISFCGQMHGLVLLDANDQVIRPAILWNDNRTVEECAYLNQVIGKENLINWTGNIAFTGFTGPKVMWVKTHEPENFARIAKIMLPKDYLVYRICGAFFSDVSDCSGTLYFDVEHKCWSKPMLSILHISENQLPIVVESFHVVGNVTEKFAKRTGLSPKSKIIVGGGDQAVGAIGTGTVDNNQLSISLGTSGVVFASCKSFMRVASGTMHSFCHANGDYHIMGVMLSAAGSLNWWIKEILRATDFQKEINEIQTVSAEKLYFLPYLTGERSPINDPFAKGMFYGLTIKHTRADMTRAVIEGVCFGLLDCFIALKETGVSCQNARVIGGGAKSDIWIQILADCLGIRVSTINTSEGGGLGAVILAMVGCGEYTSVNDACISLISDEKNFLPNKEKNEYYHSKYLGYKACYHAAKAGCI